MEAAGGHFAGLELGDGEAGAGAGGVVGVGAAVYDDAEVCGFDVYRFFAGVLGVDDEPALFVPETG